MALWRAGWMALCNRGEGLRRGCRGLWMAMWLWSSAMSWAQDTVAEGGGALPSSSALTAVSAGSASQPTLELLRVLVLRDFPPLSYRDERGVLTGFNVELAQILCAHIRAVCEISDDVQPQVLRKVAQSEVDFTTASIIVTPEREREMLFTRPYRHSKTFWIGETPLSQSRGLQVAVLEGSLQYTWAQRYRMRQHMDWTLIVVPTADHLRQVLQTRRAQAVVAPSSSALDILKQLPPDLQFRPIDDPELDRPVAVAVAPRRYGLRDRLDAALREVRHSGELDRINSKYYPFRIF